MYDPTEGEGELTTLEAALRDYFATDAQLVSLLGGPVSASIVNEGMLSEDTPMPAIMFATIATGDTYAGQGTELVRIIVYVLNRNRGYGAIERIIRRLKHLFKGDAAEQFMTFPPDAGFSVLGVEAPGTTASTTLPRYGAEARGYYLFITTIENAPQPSVPPPPPDIEAPVGPSSVLGASLGTTSVALSWDAAFDNVGVVGYRIYQGSTFLKTVTGLDTTITGLSPSTAYNFEVRAIDAAGNEGEGVVGFASTDDPPLEEPGVGTFTLTQAALAPNVDVPNPFRGLGWWRGAPRYVPDVVTETEYQRFTWDQLETSGGGINLTPLVSFVNAAKGRGRRAGFRVQSYVPEDTVKRVPSDIPTTLVNGAYIPQWDHPTFLPRLNALMAAIGALYNGSPDIAYVDIGIYGRWAEWHMFGVEAYSATQATQNGIIDAHTAHLGDCQLLMLTDNNLSLGYAMDVTTTAKPIGLRRDSWGKESQFDDAMARSQWPKAAERWKTAPFVVEAFAASGFAINTTEALAEISTYHLSNAGNANIPGLFSNLSDADKANWALIQAQLGFRYRTSQAVITASEGSATLAATWVNDGSTPTYDDFAVAWTLKKGSDQVWSAAGRELKTVLPGTPGPDNHSLPALTTGEYSLYVKVTWRTTTNVKLAQNGLQGDGSYLVGTFSIE